MGDLNKAGPRGGEGVSRRDIAILGVAASAAAAGYSVAAPARAAPVVERDVQVKTADGTCDAVLTHPSGEGAWPAALVYPDALGLRPVFREMGKRLAGEGYTVLTINQFYRSAKPPIFTQPPDFSGPNSAFMARLTELRAPLTAEAQLRDAQAFLDFLDAQAAVKKTAKMGVSGYCMGGPMTMRAAAVRPDRVAAAASFHGGGLATEQPDSPHLLVPKMKASFFFAVAQNDDEKEPQVKVKLKEAYAAAGVPAKIEVFDGAMHGWCVKGSPVYNEAAAERAWAELIALYKKQLV